MREPAMRAKRLIRSAIAFAFFFVLMQFASVRSQTVNPPAPPKAPARPVTDNYYGTKVVDPYRYMENLSDPEVQSWMKAQNDYTQAVLGRLPGRLQLLERIRELDQSVPQVFATRLPGDLYLIRKLLPKEDLYKLYLRRGLAGEDKLLVDPEQIKLAAASQSKGKNTIRYFAASGDGKYVAVGIAPGGAEVDTEIRVIETASGRETGDVITRAWGGNPQWLPDNRSFVYGRLQKLPSGAPATEIEQKGRCHLHVLGTDTEEDPAVFGYGVVPSIEIDPTYSSWLVLQPDSNYALGLINSGVSPNSAFYIEPIADLGKTNSAWRKVADYSDEVNSIAVHGDDLYLLTYHNATRLKVIRTDVLQHDLASAETIVPPGQAVVVGISPAEDALYVDELDGGIGRILRVPYGPHPRVEEVALPVQGTAFASTDPRVSGALLYTTSWTQAFKIYAYDSGTRQVTDTKLQPTGPFDDPTGIESVEVKARSYDGTLVPLSIVKPKNLKLDGSNPTLLEGYGAYGNIDSPFFSSTMLAWYERGGVYAVCHVRGGGDYGEEWRLAGKGSTKPNTWRDFIACAQYLIEKKYTSRARLAGQGVSAGGILIGRAITTRPDLFAAAIDISGCSDMLREENTANGVPNIPEFGSTKTKDGFKALYAMSPYHHVKARTAYPAVLLEAGINDPRVDAWEMAKMTAALQAATSSGRPALLRVEWESGHGGSGGTEKQAQERLADEWSFLLWQFGVPGFQPRR